MLVTKGLNEENLLSGIHLISLLCGHDRYVSIFLSNMRRHTPLSQQLLLINGLRMGDGGGDIGGGVAIFPLARFIWAKISVDIYSSKKTYTSPHQGYQPVTA